VDAAGDLCERIYGFRLGARLGREELPQALRGAPTRHMREPGRMNVVYPLAEKALRKGTPATGECFR